MSNSKYINLTTKPSNNYYTQNLQSKLLNDNSFTLYIFDTNFYKEIPVSKDENKIIENFISSLDSTNFSDSLPDSSINECFRIKIVFSDSSKYVIKVFNAENVSILPWDGTYNEDFINMQNVLLRYNLYDFCTHIASEPSPN